MNPIGPVNALYPMPTTLVGATVNGKPNFLTIAHVGILNHGTPQYLSIGLGKIHYSNAGILENRTFSICMPSEDLMVETDYCGIMTGKKTDKATLFDVFYGELETAPMIEDCPLCLECRLQDIYEFPTNNLFIGEIVAAYTEEGYLTDDKPDIHKMNPLVLTMPDNNYWTVGKHAGKAWSAGKKLKQKKN